MRRVGFAVGAAALGLVLAGCGSGGGQGGGDGSDVVVAPAASAGPATFLVNGTLTLKGANSVSQTGAAGDACVGTGGFADITNGAQVTVTGKSGQTVGLGTLDVGEVGTVGAGTPLRTCEFHFEVTEVPTGEGFYGVKVAGRNGPQFPEKDISSTTVALTLGS